MIITVISGDLSSNPGCKVYENITEVKPPGDKFQYWTLFYETGRIFIREDVVKKLELTEEE